MFFEVGVRNFSLNRFINFSKRRKPKVRVSIGENEIKFDLLSAADRFPLLFQSKVVEIKSVWTRDRYVFLFPKFWIPSYGNVPLLAGSWKLSFCRLASLIRRYHVRIPFMAGHYLWTFMIRWNLDVCCFLSSKSEVTVCVEVFCVRHIKWFMFWLTFWLELECSPCWQLESSDPNMSPAYLLSKML